MSNTDLDKTIGSCIGVILAILILPFHYFYRGWVISWLWIWYATPLGFKEITAVHGTGLVVLVAFITGQYQHEPKEKADDNTLRAIFHITVHPLIALTLGYLFKAWM